MAMKVCRLEVLCVIYKINSNPIRLFSVAENVKDNEANNKSNYSLLYFLFINVTKYTIGRIKIKM